MPATAAIDNETLDHLLSVVDDSAQCRACGPNLEGGTLSRTERQKGVPTKRVPPFSRLGSPPQCSRPRPLPRTSPPGPCASWSRFPRAGRPISSAASSPTSSSRSGQSVVVENKPGANGAIGAEYVARGEPDGHLLFLTTAGAVAMTPHLSQAELRPHARFRAGDAGGAQHHRARGQARRAGGLGQGTGGPGRQSRPGAIPFGSTGTGSITHLALELFQSAAGVKFLHVPYRS